MTERGRNLLQYWTATVGQPCYVRPPGITASLNRVDTEIGSPNIDYVGQRGYASSFRTGLSHDLEEVGDVAESYSMADADGPVAQGLGYLLTMPTIPTGRTCSCLSRNSSEQSTVTARATRPYRSRVLERRC